ncbi:LEUCINE RICH REPEAT CONTAINING PROTEIN [Salix viminalis]|uniref:LEUCINE RICH REPEAT CONTAINING PROTEIN n=1 Tax=Salix viminalis TaxID=40686 RepID=A0A9Q0UXQ4_SALVM|nr:LEUCINE RICH REPEAT CONTAINING PROTEIN [Salix viminalis]
MNLCDSSKLILSDFDFSNLPNLEVLNLEQCNLCTLPPSIGFLSQLIKLDLSSNRSLTCLPDRIGELKSLVSLDLQNCSKLASIPDSIVKLKSLVTLHLQNCSNLASLPKNIKQLPMLIELDLGGCERLQHLPQLPSTLQVLIASGCISLTSVAGVFMQGEKDYEAASQQFNFSGCLQLDQNSLTKIIGDARLRIQRMATSLFNQQYFGKPIRVQLCIPGLEVPEWFTYKNIGGPTVKFKLPAHLQLFGLTLCAVVSFGPGQKYCRGFDIKCECYLITKDGTQSDLSFHYNKEYWSSSTLCRGLY